jgi:glycosyltransferase involved in cell wall biosynthesis
MTKLLFIYGPLGGGGAERVLLDLLNNLDYTKYDVDLCLIINQGILLPEIPKEVNMLSLWENYTRYYKVAYRMSIWFRSNYLFKRVLKQKITKSYDVEISFLEGVPLKLHALMDTAAKKITWVHCDLFNFPYESKNFANKEELNAYNKMDVVVNVSKDTKVAFEKRFPKCTTKKVVVYNPLDLIKVEHLSNDFLIETKSKFTIVSVGRLTEQKRFDRLIRVAARFKKENYDLTIKIIGDGELNEDLKNLSIKLETDDMVEFVGFVNNPFPFIKNADLMVLPSAFEGFGLVVVEAMALGIPVIATRTAGPTEILEENKYGLLSEHDDESIYQAIKKLIKDDALREYYRKLGLERSKDFNVNKTMRAFDNLLETII